jgi:hypothetical protein
VPYAPYQELPDPSKKSKSGKQSKEAALVLEKREWLSDDALVYTDTQEGLWDDARRKFKDECEALVVKVVRHVVMKVSSGDSVIKASEVKVIMQDSPHVGPSKINPR